MSSDETIEKTVSNSKKEIISNSSLDDLLNWDGNINIVEYVDFPEIGSRPALHVGIRSISSEEMNKYRKAATMEGRSRTGNIIKELDDNFSSKLMLFHAITEPDLSNQSLQQRFNNVKIQRTGNSPANIIDKIFLPGERAKLMDVLFKLSGFEDEETLENKNSDLDL